MFLSNMVDFLIAVLVNQGGTASQRIMSRVHNMNLHSFTGIVGRGDITSTFYQQLMTRQGSEFYQVL